jgi:hypothetical protein
MTARLSVAGRARSAKRVPASDLAIAAAVNGMITDGARHAPVDYSSGVRTSITKPPAACAAANESRSIS